MTDDKLLSLPEQDVGVKLGECGVIVLKEIFTKLNGAVYKNYVRPAIIVCYCNSTINEVKLHCRKTSNIC